MPTRGTIFARGTGAAAFLAPALAVLAALNVVPILWSIGIAFFRFRADRPHTRPRFVGLANYLDVATDDDVWTHVGNTALLIAGSVALQIVLGGLLAWVFWRPFPGRRLVLMMVLTPMLLSTVAVGTFFAFFYDPTFGLVSMLLRPFTGGPVAPLGSPAAAVASLVFADAWMWSPFVMLMLLAGLDGIRPELWEAASVDRASAARRFRTVVWPSVRGVLLLAVLFRAIEAFNQYDLVATITAGGPGGATETVSTEIYGAAFILFQTGRASALANFAAFLILLMVGLYLHVVRRRDRRTAEGHR